MTSFRATALLHDFAEGAPCSKQSLFFRYICFVPRKGSFREIKDKAKRDKTGSVRRLSKMEIGKLNSLQPTENHSQRNTKMPQRANVKKTSQDVFSK